MQNDLRTENKCTINATVKWVWAFARMVPVQHFKELR